MKSVSSSNNIGFVNTYYINLYKVDGIKDHSDIKELAAHYDGDKASSYMTASEIAGRKDINLIEEPREDPHY